MGNDLVSIIVPVYNVQFYLSYCLDSLIMQTYKNIEIVLINDGSTDESLKVCKSYAVKDSRIKIISQQNQGLAGARNAGINNSFGNFLVFIDPDDFVTSDYIEYLMSLMDETVDISLCMLKVVNRYFIPENIGKYYMKEKIDKHEFFKRSLNSTRYISVCGKMFRKECIAGLRFPVGKLHEDIFILADVVMRTRGIVVGDKAGYFYVKREGSLTTSDFNERKFDLNQANSIYTDKVIKAFPDLSDLALAFIIHGYSIIIKQIPLNETEKYKHYIQRSIKFSRCNLLKVLVSKLIDKKEKILCLITCTNYLFIKFTWKIYDKSKFM